MYRISLSRAVEAAHRSDNLDSRFDGRATVHGHSYICRLWLAAEDLDQRGVVWDLDEASEVWTAICEQLDHTLLNDIEGLEQPSMERMCAWLYTRAADRLPHVEKVEIERPTLGFTASYVPD